MKRAVNVFMSMVLCAGILGGVSACGPAKAPEKAPASDAPSAEMVPSTGGKRVYFAGPLFNQAEQDWNLRVATVLEDHGYEVFLPQRDGIKGAEVEGKSEEELLKTIFEKDTKELSNADIVFMNLDGSVPDDGSCVELGMGYASGKRCYGFKTDSRALTDNMDLNPMIAGCLTKCFDNLDGDELIEEIDQYLDENDL